MNTADRIMIMRELTKEVVSQLTFHANSQFFLSFANLLHSFIIMANTERLTNRCKRLNSLFSGDCI